ncbi:MAG TPA: VIT and VWA domain-containing protein [Chloroflexota bacterium]|nr:VIT and VWA domain-containing protein [Chloroflexota bacterium]
MFNRVAYENSRPDGVGVLEIVRGGEGDDQPRQFVPLKRTAVSGEVTGPLAALRVTHSYGYTRAQCAEVLEAAYRFPLPGDAAVTGVRVRFGAVEIRAALAEREQAEQEYAEAREAGRQAALLTRESPDVFTLQVTGLQPDQDVTVETDYVQLARAEGAGWLLRVPLTTAPRYVRSDELATRHAQGQPLALLRDPGHRFALDLLIRGAATATSPTHALAVEEAGGDLRVRLQAGEVLPDRDCVLVWEPRGDARRPTLGAWLHAPAGAQEVYFLAQVTPPADGGVAPRVPREVILLVDHSASMSGAKWQAADWAVTRFLGSLTAEDCFALGVFHNTATWFASGPLAATPETVARAVRFLESQTDSGGTELGVALEQALALPRATGERARHVLVLTDAEVSDAGRILRLADGEAALANRRRISVLCIDAAPNAFLAEQLAERGGGVARFLTSAPEEGDITTALDAVLADWAAPVWAGLRLGVQRPRAEAAGRTVAAGDGGAWSEIDLGDLPAGRPLWVAGRAPRDSAADLALRLTTARGEELAGCRLDLAEATERPALAALFGARRVAGLEGLMHARYAESELRAHLARLGYDPDRVLAPPAGTPPRVYAENAYADARVALRRLLVAEALRYGLASAETAFVAVRTEAGQRVAGTVVVANTLPAGWSDAFLAAPAARLGPIAHRLATAAPPAAQPMFRVADTAASPLDTLGAAPGAIRGWIERTFHMGGSPSAPAEPPASAGPTPPAARPIFTGTPQFVNGEAVLFDAAQAGPAELPPAGTIARLMVRFPHGAPAPESLGAELVLLVYVDDLAAPRARVALADLVRQGGERPLNLRWQPGQPLRLVLRDPAGVWAGGAPALEVSLGR